MRLTDLAPRWVCVGFPAFVPAVPDWASHLPIYHGVTFQCPHCHVQRLGVMFEPVINTHGYVMENVPLLVNQNVWRRESGDTFETLTLSPSLDFSGPGRIDFAGHWHGHITNGEVT